MVRLLLLRLLLRKKQQNKTAQPVVATQTEAQVAPATVSNKLNINTATVSEIQKALTGIGAKKSRSDSAIS